MCNKIKIQNKDAKSNSSSIPSTYSGQALHPSSFPAAFPRAFTLVELMVSVAIVVILMVGVAQVFQMTSQAVGASQQLSDSVRNQRAINTTMEPEFLQIARDAPVLMFRSNVQYAYRNRSDSAADKDGSARTWDPLNTGAEAVQYPALPNERTHRIDQIGFMARGKFPRQTGNDGVFVAPQSSNEAFIWYGHLVLPHTKGTFYLDNNPANPKTNPGDGTQVTNPQNFFSTQWALGHVVMALIKPVGASPTGPDNYGTIQLNGVNQQFIRRDRSLDIAPKTDVTAMNNLAPLSINTQSLDNARIQDCRYDVVGTSISDFSNILKRSIGVQWQVGISFAVNDRTYYRGRMYTCTGANVASNGNIPGTAGGASSWGYNTANSDWWSALFMKSRFECNPFVVKPITAAAYSQQAPVFTQGCTQFIVEYAGDFLRQDTDPASQSYGYVLDSFDNPDAPPAGYEHTDGETDFAVTWNDANGNNRIDPIEAGTVRREVRWYGLPRDTNGDGFVKGYDVTVTSGPTMTKPQDLRDVVPFRDVAMTIHTAASNFAAFGIPPAVFSANAGTFYNSASPGFYFGAPFEKFDNENEAYPSLNVRPAYMSTADLTNASGMRDDEFYQCAWGPYDTVRPKMIRITITLDDPLSRFAEGQTFEYVFKLP